MRHLLLLPFLLSACVSTTGPTGSVQPVSARLNSEVLKVRLSNGQTCLGSVAEQGVKAWAGALTCDGWRYNVVLSNKTNPARYIVEEVLTALTLEDALAPAAEVAVTSPQSVTTTFVHPGPR